MGNQIWPKWARLLPMLAIALGPSVAAASDWMYYGGDEGGGRYSSLDQINRDTVGDLQLAWSFRTGIMAQHADLAPLVAVHATPVLPVANFNHAVQG